MGNRNSTSQQHPGAFPNMLRGWVGPWKASLFLEDGLLHSNESKYLQSVNLTASNSWKNVADLPV